MWKVRLKDAIDKQSSGSKSRMSGLRIMEFALAGKKDGVTRAIDLGSSFANLSAHLIQEMMLWKQSLSFLNL